jgi:hypothetical protein
MGPDENDAATRLADLPMEVVAAHLSVGALGRLRRVSTDVSAAVDGLQMPQFRRLRAPRKTRCAECGARTGRNAFPVGPDGRYLLTVCTSCIGDRPWGYRHVWARSEIVQRIAEKARAGEWRPSVRAAFRTLLPVRRTSRGAFQYWGRDVLALLP